MGNSGSSSTRPAAPRKDGGQILSNLIGPGVLRVGPMFRNKTSISTAGRHHLPLKSLVEKIPQEDLQLCIRHELNTSQLMSSFGSTFSNTNVRGVCASYNLHSMRFFREAYLNNELYCVEGTDLVYRKTEDGMPDANFWNMLAYERQGLTNLETLAKEAAGIVKIPISPDKRAEKDARLLPPNNRVWTFGYVLAILWVSLSLEDLRHALPATPQSESQPNNAPPQNNTSPPPPPQNQPQGVAPPPYMQ